jgi:hypothetical protein
MLAEKFFLLLETLRSQVESYADGSAVIVSVTQHVPVKLRNRDDKR